MYQDKSSLKSLFSAHADSLNQSDSVFVADKLNTGKGLSKQDKALENFASGAEGEILLLIDLTAFGSVAEGFCITPDYIYAKQLYEDKVSFHIPSIRNMFLDLEDRKIVVDGVSVAWGVDYLDDKMKIVFDCLKMHLDSLKKHDLADVEDYGSALAKKLEILQWELISWNASTLSKVIKAQNEYGLGATSCGFENFFEKISISFNRDFLLKEYKNFRKQAEEYIKNINSSSVFEEIEKEFGEKFSVNYDFVEPDNDKSVSNTDWSSRMDDAIQSILDCPSSLNDQLDQIIEKVRSM